MIEDTNAEVNKFLDRRQREYELFLDDVVRELRRFKDSDHLKAIYQIYTRAEKQPGGSKLKSRAGIAKKLLDWRNDSRYEIEAQVPDIHDIIGTTIVVYFASDVENVCKALENLNWQAFKFVDRSVKKEKGYFADHIIVERRAYNNSIFKPLCEIQVKTLLHDGWATKTHDLTYKSRVKIDPNVEEQMALLGKNIQNLEEQSDGLRAQILKVAENDKARRRAAALQLAYAMTQANAPTIDENLKALGQQIVDNQDHLCNCPIDDPILQQIVERWRANLEKSGLSRPLCRCIVLLATIRIAGDFDYDAIEAIELWVKSENEREVKHGAISFSALAQWVLGHFEGAVEEAKAALAYAETHGLDTKNGHMNLAYYWAEKIFSEGETEYDDQLVEIKKLIASTKPPSCDRDMWSHNDTVGAIEIMAARTSAEVRAGLRKCEMALEASEKAQHDTKVFRAFFDLHEKRALQKLNEFSARGAGS